MSFRLPHPQVKNNFQDYLFALLVILGAYIAGNIPALIVHSQLQADSDNFIQVLQEGVGNTVTFVLLLLPWVFVFFVLYPVTRFIIRWPFQFLITNREKIDYKRFFFGFSLWFLICLITFFATKNELVLDNFQGGKFFPLLIIASVVLLIQCAAEELIFRSFLLKWLAVKIPNGLLQALITGVIFGYLHASNPEVEAIGNKALIYYVGTGVFLGLLAIIDDGLELSAGFHFANNLFAALMVTSDWQVFQTDAVFLDTNPPAFSILDFVFAFGGQLLFFLICRKVFRWRSIKSKLL